MKPEVLDLEDLHERSVFMRSGRLTGLYFLFSGDDLVYVGQTVSFLARLAEHSRQKIGEFDRVSFLPMRSKYLDVHELAYILLYRPRLNKLLNSPSLRRDRRCDAMVKLIDLARVANAAMPLIVRFSDEIILPIVEAAFPALKATAA